jgi:hypothetical protein
MTTKDWGFILGVPMVTSFG